MSALTVALPTLLWQWLLASLGCVLAGLVLHAALALAARAWPALRGRRLVWLTAQAVVTTVALLPFLPALDRVTVAPALHLALPSPLPLSMPLSMPAPAVQAGAMPAPAVQAGAMPAPAVRTGALPAAAVTTASTVAATGDHAQVRRGGYATNTAMIAAGANDGTMVVDPARAGAGAIGPASAATSGNPATGAATALLAWTPLLWAAIYVAGLAYAVRRVLRAWLLWRGLLAGAQRLSRQALGAHGGFTARQLHEIARHRVAVMETDSAVSPMLVGAWRPVLLLPRHLRTFCVIEQQMVIAHELQHRRARDPWMLGLSALVQTLLWFNPAPRWFGARLAWAVELACDRRVLAGRPPQQRKQYAGALLAQWRAQLLAPPAAALAFGAADADTVGERIAQLRHARAPALPATGACAVAAVLIGVLAAGALLRPALAVGSVPALPTDPAQPAIRTRPAGQATAPTAPAPSPAPAPASASATASATATAPASAPVASAPVAASAPIAWQYPLDKMRVSGFFGVMRKVSPRPSMGLDLPAPVGTPVRAAAAGVVTAAGELNENNGRYGTAVVIDSGHGAGTTQAVYAHLDTTAVQPGARVAAGQVIGTVGLSGFTTGPHLHFQLRQHGQAIDPATVLASLDRYATRHALAVRRQQLGY